MFVELIEHSKKNRGNIVHISEVDISLQRDYEAYVSLMPYDDTIHTHLEITKTPEGFRSVTGFEGKCYCRWIFWDFDHDELVTSHIDAKTVVNVLHTKYGVPLNDIGVYFSGRKGFHVCISSSNVGHEGLTDASELASIISTFTERLIGESPRQISSFDSSLYAVNRYFRLPHSRHPSTGYYKISILAEDFIKIKLDEILRRAEVCESWPMNPSPKVLPKKKLVSLFESCLFTEEFYTEEEREALEEIPETEVDKFQLAVRLTQSKYSVDDYWNKNRNNYTFQLAAWCNDLGIGQQGDGDSVYDLIIQHRVNDLGDKESNMNLSLVKSTIRGAYRRMGRGFGSKKNFLTMRTGKRAMSEKQKVYLVDEVSQFAGTLTMRKMLKYANAVNAASRSPLPEEEVAKIVLKYGNAIKDVPESLPRVIHDFADDFIQKQKKRQRKTGIGFPSIDKAENYDYEAKVIQIIGLGGVGKSFFLKTIAQNVTKDEPFLYSSMEDTGLRLLERVMRGHFDPIYLSNENTGFEDVIEGHEAIRLMARYEDEVTVKEKIVSSLRGSYSDNFLVDERTGLGEKDYRKLAEYLLSKYGSIWGIGIDGMSAMERKGDEIASLVNNSFSVKEIANDYKICVPTLVHTPAVKRFKRDLWDDTRGGVKVNQNGDCFIALSSILNEEESSPGNPVYYNDKVFMNYWGKRTSGQYISKLLQMNTDKMIWEESDEELEDYI